MNKKGKSNCYYITEIFHLEIGKFSRYLELKKNTKALSKVKCDATSKAIIILSKFSLYSLTSLMVPTVLENEKWFLNSSGIFFCGQVWQKYMSEVLSLDYSRLQ